MREILLLLAVASTLAVVPSARAQQPAASPVFDVASLKPVALTPGPYRANLGTDRHGEVKLTNVTLGDCLKFAYGITNDAQIAGPAWINNKDVRFNIEAKAQPDTPRDQLLLMLQNLLAERFRMALHREQRELTVLRLVVARNGPKIRGESPDATGSGPRFAPGVIVSDRLTMPVLATLLSRFSREPVLDETGLSGAYDVNLQWTPETRPTPPTGGAAEPDQPGAPAPDHPSIFSAVQEQLGLKLERRKGPLEVLVVDRADRVPVAN